MTPALALVGSRGWSSIVRTPRVSLRRAGAVAYLLCRGCGRSSDVERDPLELQVAGIAHSPNCPVAQALWADMIHSGLDENGRPVQGRPSVLRRGRRAREQAVAC